MVQRRSSFAIALSVLVCSQVVAAELATLVLDQEPLKLLGDHIRIRMPAGAVISPREVGVMEANASPEAETRVVFDNGTKRIVLMAHETFSTAGPDFAEQVKKIGSEWIKEGLAVTTVPLITTDKFRVLQTRASRVDITGAATFISTAWVVNADQSVQQVAAYANPDAAKTFDDTVKFCDQVLATITMGGKGLRLKARIENLDIYSATKALAVDLPEGYMVAAQKGPDFLVHRIFKVAQFGSDQLAIGVYVGGHPSFQHGHSDTSTTKVDGTFVGRKAEWFRFSEGPDISMEAIAPVEEGSDHLQFHVFYSAPTAEDQAALQKIVGSMRVVPQHSP